MYVKKICYFICSTDKNVWIGIILYFVQVLRIRPVSVKFDSYIM